MTRKLALPPTSNVITSHLWSALDAHNVRRLSKLPHECEDIAENAWRIPLNA